MTDATDKVACGDDLERMLRFLLRGDPRDEGLDSVDETADRLSGAGLETRGQGFEARREDTPGQAITVEGFPARTEKKGHYSRIRVGPVTTCSTRAVAQVPAPVLV